METRENDGVLGAMLDSIVNLSSHYFHPSNKSVMNTVTGLNCGRSIDR